MKSFENKNNNNESENILINKYNYYFESNSIKYGNKTNKDELEIFLNKCIKIMIIIWVDLIH